MEISNLNSLSYSLIVSFLQQENGGPGLEAVGAAVVSGIFFYAVPRGLNSCFPASEDGYSFSARRVAVGGLVRTHLKKNPGLVNLCLLAQDTVFIAMPLFFLFNRAFDRNPHWQTWHKVGIFPAACVLVEGFRSCTFFAMQHVEKNNPNLLGRFAHNVARWIRPSIWNE